MLAADLDKRSRSGNVTLTGPVPLVPLTFSAYAATGSTRQQEPILAVMPPLGSDPPDALLRLMRGTIAEHHCEKSALAEPTVG